MKKLFSLLLSMTLLVCMPGLFAVGTPRGRSAEPDAPEGPRDLFVSPEGDDAAAGTKDAPLHTLAAAKEKLKEGWWWPKIVGDKIIVFVSP